jgi:hypothetical protein
MDLTRLYTWIVKLTLELKDRAGGHACWNLIINWQWVTVPHASDHAERTENWAAQLRSQSTERPPEKFLIEREQNRRCNCPETCTTRTNTTKCEHLWTRRVSTCFVKLSSMTVFFSFTCLRTRRRVTQLGNYQFQSSVIFFHARSALLFLGKTQPYRG